MLFSHHLEWLNTVKYKNNNIEHILPYFFKLTQLQNHRVGADCGYMVEGECKFLNHCFHFGPKRR